MSHRKSVRQKNVPVPSLEHSISMTHSLWVLQTQSTYLLKHSCFFIQEIYKKPLIGVCEKVKLNECICIFILGLCFAHISLLKLWTVEMNKPGHCLWWLWLWWCCCCMPPARSKWVKWSEEEKEKEKESRMRINSIKLNTLRCATTSDPTKTNGTLVGRVWFSG